MLPFNWMIGFGNQFPYTNFHELNLDWIIAVCKDLTEKFPDIVHELLLKLNAPEQAGEVGQFLVNLGNGKTGWQDINENFVPVIIDAVNEWLEDHPEATTTVQDASLTLAKMTEQTAYTIDRKESGLLAPVYIGDYLTDSTKLPSATVYVNDKFYCVNAPEDGYATENHTGIGTVSVFDLATNRKEIEYNVLTGHGNSIAYDGNCFYIAPVWEYGTERTNTRKIYKYTSNFVLIEELEAPSQIMGLSYDSYSDMLYALDYNGRIYKYEDNILMLHTVITNWLDFYPNENILSGKSYNQDIAINKGEFFISSPFGNILHGKLSTGNSIITDFFQMMRTDSTARFILGELEGMEFTNNHLYALVYTVLPNGITDAFVVELPVNHANATSPVMEGAFFVTDATLTLSVETQAKFSLNTYEIRSLLQLMCRTLNEPTSQIEIPATSAIVEDYDIYFPNKSLTLVLNGSLTCHTIIISGGELNIYTPSESNMLVFTNNGFCINVRRSAELKISGTATLNMSAPNVTTNYIDFIVVGYYMPRTIIRQTIANTANKPLMIGGAKLHPYEVYYGSTPTIFMPDSFTFHEVYGFLSGSQKDLHITIKTPKAIRNNQCTMTGTITVRGNLGYLDNAFYGIDTTDMTKEYIKKDDYTLEIVLRKSDDTAFTNCDNNVPVVVSGNIAITWQ